jgi:hypothetical protein
LNYGSCNGAAKLAACGTIKGDVSAEEAVRHLAQFPGTLEAAIAWLRKMGIPGDILRAIWMIDRDAFVELVRSASAVVSESLLEEIPMFAI